MSTATLDNALGCPPPGSAQKRSSPEVASSTRTYAWAPQRSQTSKAVSGLVGAMAPVNVASSRGASGCYVRLAPVLRLTVQCNTYPGAGVPYSGCSTPQAKPHPDASYYFRP